MGATIVNVSSGTAYIDGSFQNTAYTNAKDSKYSWAWSVADSSSPQWSEAYTANISSHPDIYNYLYKITLDTTTEASNRQLIANTTGNFLLNNGGGASLYWNSGYLTLGGGFNPALDIDGVIYGNNLNSVGNVTIQSGGANITGNVNLTNGNFTFIGTGDIVGSTKLNSVYNWYATSAAPYSVAVSTIPQLWDLAISSGWAVKQDKQNGGNSSVSLGTMTIIGGNVNGDFSVADTTVVVKQGVFGIGEVPSVTAHYVFDAITPSTGDVMRFASNAIGGGLLAGRIGLQQDFLTSIGSVYMGYGANPNTQLVLQNGGKVGIGTAQPLSLLHVNGAGKFAGAVDGVISFTASTVTLTGGDLTVLATAGAASSKLKTSNLGSIATYTIEGNRNSNATITNLLFSNNNDSVANISTIRAGAHDAADMVFWTQETTAGSLIERMRINSHGGVNIPNSLTLSNCTGSGLFSAYQVYQTSPIIGDMWMKHYSSVTVLNAISQFETVCGTSSILNTGVTSGFDMPLNNRLRYRNATSSMTMEVFWAGYASPVIGTDWYEIALFKNGIATEIPSESEVDFASQSRTLPFAGHTMVTMSQNDYLELKVKNIESNNDIYIKYYNIIARAVKIQR